jgi:metallophosphoesterase superfamily enzyme
MSRFFFNIILGLILMPNETLFISDLHLTIERPEITQKFLKLLTGLTMR